jgi:hypothetical protein
MNGDEDLGEDITMKGNKFHFNQQPTNTANVQLSDKSSRQQRRTDISEEGIDENVHWFANPNTETLNWPRANAPYANNGSGPKAHQDTSLYQRRRTDIGEKGIDEDVHDFVSSQPEIPRLAYRRPEEAYSYNGSGPKAHAVSLMQDGPTPSRRTKKDISENGIDEEVHGFANGMTETLNWPRVNDPYAPNGSGPSAHQGVHQRKRRDISENGIDEEVHGFANGMTDLNWPRVSEPFAYNGSGPTAHQNTLYQMRKSDIANKEVRPDVYTTVHSMVNPTAYWRSNKAPKYEYEPWWGEDAAPPRTDLPVPPCPTEEADAEPDLATLKNAKIMADEKAKDAKREAAEDAKEEASIKAAEEE